MNIVWAFLLGGRSLVLGILIGACLASSALGGSGVDVEKRMEMLRDEIAYHDTLYYQKSAPVITDAEYDLLKRELMDLEQTYPEFADANQAHVGDDRDGGFPSYRHGKPMLGLHKSYTEKEVRRFHDRVIAKMDGMEPAYIVEPKYDGLAISVVYEYGRLVRAVTRGNGIEGDDVTANVRTITGLPMELRSMGREGAVLPLPDRVELRGEVYLTYAEFDRINAERVANGEEPYAHPRNLASGSLKLVDPDKVAPRRLSIVFYGWGLWEPLETKPTSQFALHGMLREWGLPGVTERGIAHGIDEVWMRIVALGQRRSLLGYPIDGAVIKVNEVFVQDKLGWGAGAPHWALAYKFPATQATTRIRAIIFQVGRTGSINPVAEMEPVVIEGTTIARATLHNRRFIDRLDVRVGDYVQIEKAGDIVPAIVGVDISRRSELSRPLVFPEVCPVCGEPLVSRAESVVVRCYNARCPARILRRLELFTSSAGVNIDGLGPARIAELVDQGEVTGIVDFYHLDLESMSGVVPEASAVRLLAAIEDSKQAELWRFIAGLGIERVGPTTAKTLAIRFKSLESLSLMNRQDLISVDKSSRVKGVSVVTAEGILTYFAKQENREIITGLLAVGVQPMLRVAAMSRVLQGKVFVLTGTLPGLTRGQAEDLIGRAGGVVHSQVRATTDYLVSGSGAGQKLERARQLGVPVIGKAELVAMIEETN